MWKLSGGLFLGWSLGANDAANVFGPAVGSGLVRYRSAIILTSLFILLGAIVEGHKCMENVGGLSSLSPLMAFICVTAAGITMFLLTYVSLPASSSHAVIGAIIGGSLISGKIDVTKLYEIIICWIMTPIGGVLISIALYISLGFLFKYLFKEIRRRFFLFMLRSFCPDVTEPIPWGRTMWPT